ALNDYLRKYAWLNQQTNAARPYVAARGGRVVGHYTLAAGSVRRKAVTARGAKGLARHPVPVIFLDRPATTQSEQGKGLGATLLEDALLRAAQATDLIGCRSVLVQAKDEAAQTFYRRFGFESTPVAPLHLYLLTKDIRASSTAGVRGFGPA